MNTALTVRQPLTPDSWRMISEVSTVLHQSRLFGVSSPAQAQAVVLKGFELGIPFTASFDLIKVIEGRPELTPRGALAMLHQSPIIKSIKINRLAQGTQYVGHEVTIERTNGFTYTARWTLDDAKRAQLLKPNSGWDKYPENMCLWRAVGFCADVAAPDVLMGNTALMTRPEQFNVALTPEGDVIDAPVVEVVTLEALIARYGADAVIAANGGTIPEGEQVAAVAAVLGGK